MLQLLVRLNPNRHNYFIVLTFLHLVCGDIHGQYVCNFFRFLTYNPLIMLGPVRLDETV